MKWYWILLIILGAIALGMIITLMVKPKANSPATKTNPIGPRTVAPDSVKVEKGEDVDVITKDNADGSKTIAVARTK